MARQISTVIAGVFRFDTIVRREGRRGRRVAIPKPVVRGLWRTGWSRAAPLKIAAQGVVWTTTARKMGGAIVVALPAPCKAAIGDIIDVELWQASPAAREFVDG